MAKPLCSIIVVTYNSQKFIAKCLECIHKQTYSNYKVLLVDSGSRDRDYLSALSLGSKTELLFAGNGVGFCRANNVGVANLPPESEYVFFLNPDAFIASNFLEEAITLMEKPQSHSIGAVTGTTLGYDIASNTPTGFYDTTGIFHNWYGKWYDRDQGKEYIPNKYEAFEEVPGICGAVFFCRKTALESVYLNGREVFDESFYMYKEDIDLSRRLRKQGWRLVFSPNMISYHCRGWQQDRGKMPKEFRLISARNEWRIHLRLRSLTGLFYSGIKYAAVRLLNI